jgi:hypothetical protein
VETQFVREPLMRLSKKVVAALSSQDVQQTIWLPRFVHLVTHAKTPAPDDLLARMARHERCLRLIDHTRPRPRAIAPLIYRHPVVREASRPEKATNVFNFWID